MNHCRNRRTGIADPHPAKLIAILTALLVVPMAQADGGVFEINQTCAVNGGCFVGDDPGFPVEITKSGSYVLTGNLAPPADMDGIQITVDNVSIDLGGFSVQGEVECNGTPVTGCNDTDFSVGINGVTASGVSVSDGVVSGHPGFGITLGTRAFVAGVRASGNAADGVAVDEESLVRNVIARRNGETGIDAMSGSRIIDSIGYGNTVNGLSTGVNGIISGSVGNENGGNGIGAGSNSKVLDSTANLNSANGVQVQSGGLLRGVTASENGQRGAYLFNSRSNVANSSFIDNTGFGIECEFGDSSAIRDVILDLNNSGGDQFGGTCLSVGATLCSGDQTCP
ncbi:MULTISPECIES: hypothetical protein [unclassified Wenzhouxiangella]|uniref:hypothetical protein n=1 Tax=unclassified Wenzhouxiangella TaxID=2613841 RepID=UPI000E327FB6|nr:MULTISPECIES: hypothetical protein [unclassified Wenzhouxiangella]RFF26720.1 hypothetical protein DZK25_11695 [Wenzhouxiangella sp. 15181]RFP69310.1 hypothetical protein DZK26_04350 [Wenzhouxiangella sp. 15190]